MLFRRIPVLHPQAEWCVLGDKLVAVVAYRPSPLRQAEASAAPLLSLKDPQPVSFYQLMTHRPFHTDSIQTAAQQATRRHLGYFCQKKPGKTPPESTSTKYPYSLIYPGDSSGWVAVQRQFNACRNLAVAWIPAVWSSSVVIFFCAEWWQSICPRVSSTIPSNFWSISTGSGCQRWQF